MTKTLLLTLSLAVLTIPTLVPGAAATVCGNGPFNRLNDSHGVGYISPAAPTDWWIYDGNVVTYTLVPHSTQDLSLRVYAGPTCTELCRADAAGVGGSERCLAAAPGPHYIRVTWVGGSTSSLPYTLIPVKTA